MKSIEQYIHESRFINYDEKRHIAGVDFSKLTNAGYTNILNDIEAAHLDMLISPEEEEFDYQWMTIYWDKLMIEFYMPNIFTNGRPTGFNFKIRIDKDSMNRWMNGNYEWEMDDFKLHQVPSTFVAISSNTGMDISKFKTQLYTLVAMLMNRQSEPLW